MRTYKALLFLFLLPLLFMMPSSCSKTGYTIVNTTADSATQIINANDELNINYEVDQAVNEALLATSLCNIASGNTGSAGTGAILFTTISGCIIDTSHITDSALIRLTYYSKNADQTKGRSGAVTIQFGRDSSGKVIPWNQPGAIVNISFSQYEVIVLATNVSLWMNGTATVTNLSGGLLKNPANLTLATGDSLQDKLNATIVFTYNDNVAVVQTWTWYMNQLRTFNFQNASLISTIRGDSTVNNITGIATSGTTRFGFGFNTQIISPVVQTISSLYLLSEPTSGEKGIRGIPEPLTVLYGVDTHGNPVQTGAPYGYKISWAANGGQATTIVAY